MQALKDQSVLVLGLGASGLAMTRWCVRAGAHVTVADTREAPPQLTTLREEMPAVRFVHGELDATLVESMAFDRVLKSPGLSPASIAPLLSALKSRNTRTGSELSLFVQALADLKAVEGYDPAVVAITGTNGKTTVTALAGQLVERAGKSVAVAGNIGPSLLDTLAHRIEEDALPQVWVLELSSFQLDATCLGSAGLEPTVSTVLNISQDHLDWHGNMEAYVAAKAQVFGAQGRMVLNREDPHVMGMLPPAAKGKAARPYTTFGGDMPQRPGDFGIEDVNGMAWLVRALEADETRKPRRDGTQARQDIHIQRLMPADALRIRGRHNAVNALAALALTTAVGCALGPMLYGLRDYRGEPHRVELVGLVNGVEYFDDSKGTNVGATVAALIGLGTERRLVVILGGDGKGQDFAPLAAPVARHVRVVVLIGRDGPRIAEALVGSAVPLVQAQSMAEAVRLASAHAQAGDAVLMSPACASFDMFDNYGHRAQVFREAVSELASEAGVELEGSA